MENGCLNKSWVINWHERKLSIYWPHKNVASPALMNFFSWKLLVQHTPPSGANHSLQLASLQLMQWLPSSSPSFEEIATYISGIVLWVLYYMIMTKLFLSSFLFFYNHRVKYGWMNDSPVSLFCLVAYSAICVDLHKTVKEKKRKKKVCGEERINHSI